MSAKGHHGKSPLMISSGLGDHVGVELLLKAKAAVDTQVCESGGVCAHFVWHVSVERDAPACVS